MKIKEFKRAIDSIGFYSILNLKVEEDEFDFLIKLNHKTCATVSKSTLFCIDTYYKYFEELDDNVRANLLDAMNELAETPLDERQEEKRYIIPLPHLVTTDGEQQYLTHNGSFFASRRDKELRQTWKEEHLKYIPEEYRKYAVEVEE